jgi:CRISPR-associated protein Csd1
MYDNCSDKVGVSDDAEITLLPIGHSTQNAQIEVTLDMEGNLRDAVRVPKEEAETIIPVTEDSANRSSGIAAHPLEDKLIYIAGDYEKYVKSAGKKTSDYYAAYINGLSAWANSKYGNAKVRAVYDYLSEGTLIADLIKKKVLIAGEDGCLSKKEKISGIAQEEAFVRFKVEDVGNVNDESSLWKIRSMYDDFQKFYQSSFQTNGTCYATGRESYCSDKHSGKIRHSADKSKLISANDASGFTYRGRFTSKEEANAVSYEISQKAHNALKWIIQRENIRFEEMVMVAFRTNDGAMLDVIDSIQPRGLFDNLDEDLDDEQALPADNGEMYAKALKNSIFGGKLDLADDDDIVVMTLEAATTGRLSITYYREMSGSMYKRSIERWKLGCKWYYHDFYISKNKEYFPSLEEIVRCAYGAEQGSFVKVKDKLNKMTISRLIPCVIDEKPIPSDIVNGAVINVSRPVAFGYQNWNRLLRSTCAIIREHYYEKGDEYKMELEERRERDYLYGRLLAVAEIAERTAMGDVQRKERNTNAQRYMAAFQKRPFTTWLELRKRLQPYFNKMKPEQSKVYLDLIDSITNMFEYDEFRRNDPLDGTYLLGYSNQKNAGIHINGGK